MNTKELIEKHQRCIHILYSIQRFELRKQSKIESLKGFPGTFKKLHDKLEHDIEIIDLCIERLWNNYNQII